MLKYKILKHESGQFEVVKQGWSWPAFFFVILWALVNKQWVKAIITMIALNILFALMLESSYREDSIFLSYLVISITIRFVFGINGNAWREKRLFSRGYEVVDMVFAKNSYDVMEMLSKLKEADASTKQRTE